MAQKAQTNFARSRNLINKKISLQYIEPEQIEVENPEASEEPTLNEARDDLDTLIEDYKQIELLAADLDKEIDALAQDVVINLDEDQDAHIIEALNRLALNQQITSKFDPKTLQALNKKQIPYALYKQCLEEHNKEQVGRFKGINISNILKAEKDPFRNAFGGLNLPPGLKRPELDETTKTIKPINLKNFKILMVKELFKTMTPMFINLATPLVKKLIKKIL